MQAQHQQQTQQQLKQQQQQDQYRNPYDPVLTPHLPDMAAIPPELNAFRDQCASGTGITVCCQTMSPRMGDIIWSTPTMLEVT